MNLTFIKPENQVGADFGANPAFLAQRSIEAY